MNTSIMQTSVSITSFVLYVTGYYLIMLSLWKLDLCNSNLLYLLQKPCFFERKIFKAEVTHTKKNTLNQFGCTVRPARSLSNSWF